MNEEKIKRLKKTAEIEFVEKKSLFIGYSTIVESEEQALKIIKQRKKEFQDATHNVYAYITENSTVARYSDDGEPQGTAGMPILNAIRMSGITDVCVVVTRYFGGIMLGAGGLVRAYSTTASMALDAGGVSIYGVFDEIICKCSYSDYQKLRNIILSHGAITDDTVFDTEIKVKIAIPHDRETEFIKDLNDTFGGRILTETVGKRLDCE